MRHLQGHTDLVIVNPCQKPKWPTNANPEETGLMDA